MWVARACGVCVVGMAACAAMGQGAAGEGAAAAAGGAGGAQPETQPVGQPAPGAEGAAAAAGQPVGEVAEKKWEIAIAPYIWMPSYSGDVGVKGVTANIDQTFIDILDNSDRVFGLMGVLDAKYGRLVFQFNGAWTTAQFEEQKGLGRNVLASGELSAQMDVDSTWLEFVGGYRLIEKALDEGDPTSKRRLYLDAYAGARVTILSTNTTLSTATDVTLPDGTFIEGGKSRVIDQEESWVAPIIGLRLGCDLSERWSFIVRGDIGGFGAGSDFEWQAAGLFAYRWFTSWGGVSAYIGFRALGQDYTNGGFTWDMTTYGPLLGVAFQF